MENGFLSIVLHAHLPYVRHPEHDSFFEENWLFEAITECYIPLISRSSTGCIEDKVELPINAFTLADTSLPCCGMNY